MSWAPDPAAAAVTGYSVQATPAPGGKVKPGCSAAVSVTAPATDSSIVVGGLCSDMAYVAKVRGVNAAGSGPWSGSSNPVAPLPAQVPAAPLVTGVLARDHSLVVRWSPPTSDGGSAITGYSLSATSGTSTVKVNAPASAVSATVSGLTDRSTYTLALVATNALGSSAAAAASAAPRPAYAPGGPRQFGAVPSGTGTVNLSWVAPADDGGSSLSDYQVTYVQVVRSSSGGWVPPAGAKTTTVTAAPSATSLSVGGFSPANAYWSFSIAAVNAAGLGQRVTGGTPVTPTTTVGPNTVVLTSATMAGLAADANGYLTWPAPAPAQVATLKVGQVLVASQATAAPRGLLDTVQSVTKTGSGGYVVGVAQAALSDAFSVLSLSSAVNPLSSGAGASTTQGRTSAPVFRPGSAGVRIIRRPAAGVTFSSDIALAIDLGAGPLSVSGEVDLSPTVALNIALSRNFVGVPDGALVSASASLDAKASLSASIHGDAKWKIGEIDSPEIDMQIGPVPVVLFPKVPVYLTASGQISFGVSAAITIGAQASWDSRDPGHLSVKNTSTPLTVSGNPLENVSGTASVGLSERPEVLIYDASGPEFQANEDLVATLNLTPAPGEAYLSIGPSLSLQAGWTIDLLGFNASLQATIASQAFAPFLIKQPPGASLTVAPASPSVTAGTTQTFTAKRSDGQTDPLKWTIRGGAGDTITSAGVLTTVAPGGRTLTVIASDTTGAVGQTDVTVGTPVDAPQTLELTSALDGRSATAAWSAPAQTGGAALASYTVVTDPATAIQTVPASSPQAVLAGLTPGLTYLVTVYATNVNGLRSGPETASFTPSVTCSISWTATTSNAWADPTNWSPQRVPNASDLVCVTSATVDVAAATTVYGLTLQGSELITDQAMTVTDLLSIGSGSAVGGVGSLTAAAGSTASLAAGTALAGVHLVNRGSATVAGPYGVQLSGSATFENAGSLSLSDGAALSFDGGAGQLVNDPRATISYSGGSQGATIGLPFVNRGRLSATGGTVTFTQAVSLAGTGSFAGTGAIVMAGTLSPLGAGVNVADVTVSGGLAGPGTLTVPAGGRVDLAASASITGVALVNKGTVTLGGPYGVQLRAAATVENAGSLVFSDGSVLTYDGSADRLLNDAGAVISYPGGTQGATIGVPFENHGTVSAAGGTLTFSQDVLLAATGSFTGAGTMVVAATLSPLGPAVNLADITVSGGLTGPGTLTVPSGGSVAMSASSSITALALVNKGRLVVGGPYGVQLRTGATIENVGTLELADGSALISDGTAARLVNDAGALISYAGGSQGATIGVPFENLGTASAAGGTLTLAAAVSVASTGSFTGSGAITVASTLSPVGSGVNLADVTVTGALIGPGALTVPPGGAVTLGAGSSLTALALVNKGTVTLAGPYGVQMRGSATFENAGSIVLGDGSYLGYDGSADTLVNDAAATISYAGGTQGAAIGVPFDNHGSVSAAAGAVNIYVGNTRRGSDTGSYSAAAAAAIGFAGGSRVLGSGFQFTGPGALEVTGGTMTIPSSTSIANLVVSGARITGPGTLAIPAGGVLSLGSGAVITGGVHLVNDATAASVQSDAAPAVQGGSTVENAGTLTLGDGSSLYGSPDAGQLVNDAGATIAYAGGPRGATIGLPFDNRGLVSANVGAAGGTLTVGGGSDTGTYSVTSGGTVAVQGARALANTFSFRGPGQFAVVGGGTASVSGAVSIPNLAIESGGHLTGPGTVTVPVGGALSLGTGGSLDGAVRLVNRAAGANVQTGSYVAMADGATLENAGTLTLADGSYVSNGGTNGALVNDAGATVAYAGGTQGATIAAPFDNHGAVSANVGTRGGTLSVSAGNTAGGSDTGTYAASAGGAVAFASGGRVLANSFRFTGPGNLAVNGGTVTVPGAVSIPSLVIASGQLLGPGTVTVPARGILALGAGAVLGGGVRLINDSTKATVEAGNAVSIFNGATLENAGTLALADGAYIGTSDPGQLLNDSGATVSYLGGSQGAVIAVAFDNHGTVVANVGTLGGTLHLAAGNTTSGTDTGSYSMSARGTIDLQGGYRTLDATAQVSGTGSFAIDGADVTDWATYNGPALVLNSGVLELTGLGSTTAASMSAGGSGTLQMDVSGSTPHGAPAPLVINGPAVLGGTLVLQPAPGFAPPSGSVFDLIDYASHTGAFTFTPPAGQLQYAVSAGARSLTASVSGSTGTQAARSRSSSPVQPGVPGPQAGTDGFPRADPLGSS